MTVSYQAEVASSTSGGFTRLLFMWKGSLWKLIYRELALFLFCFVCISAFYRYTLPDDQKRLFEKVAIYSEQVLKEFPLSFVLGFYVAYVAGRWWNQYEAIPWPDKVMHSIALSIYGDDEHGRMIRRTLMRYINLTLTLVLRSISSAVKRRFPTYDHLVEAGFITQDELQLFLSVPNSEFNTYWIPCTWFISLLKRSNMEKRVIDSQGLKLIMEEFNEFRSKCGILWSYDWISIPLVYTQVVTIATYTYFAVALIARQYIINNDSVKKAQLEIDIFFPFFTVLQFLFYMGLLKVAEQLINPFGDDDEDFELNWLIDRHTKVSYLGVDILMRRSPALVKDKYFDEFNLILPYTGAAVSYKKKTYRGSVHNMTVPEDQQSMFLPEIVEEDEEDRSSSRGNRVTPKASLTTMHCVNCGAENNSDDGLCVHCANPAGIWRNDEREVTKPDPGLLQHGVELDEIMVGINNPRNDSTVTLASSHSNSNASTVEKDEQNKLESDMFKKILLAKHASYVMTDKKLIKRCSDGDVLKKIKSPSPLATAGDITMSELYINNPTKRTIVRSNTSISPSMLRRRNSGIQWKGVRWKPMLEDSVSDLDLTESKSEKLQELNEKIYSIYKPRSPQPQNATYLTTEEIQDLMKHKKLGRRDSSSSLGKTTIDLSLNLGKQGASSSGSINKPMSSLPNVNESSEDSLNPQPEACEPREKYKRLESDGGQVNTSFQSDGSRDNVTWSSLPVLNTHLSMQEGDHSDSSMV
uniref:Bestrophin homolog n=2 Tax=Cacopsylla melanoneura TaxID=428564 RepID=A0A8D8S0K8_9HEMI